jgi:hypothetical protein
VYHATFEVSCIDKRKLFEATQRDGECDTALPQTWCDAPCDIAAGYKTNWELVQAKLGAVWYYPPDNIWGEPLFVTDMLGDIGIAMHCEY